MKTKIITDVQNQMKRFLNQGQYLKLTNVLLNLLKDISKIATIDEENTAIKILQKLLNNWVKVYKITNLVKSEEFLDKLKHIINSYVNYPITNEEVIKELIAMHMKLRMNMKSETS